MSGAVVEEREFRINVLQTGRIADAAVKRRTDKKPRFLYEQMKRGQLRPRGVSPARMPYVRYHAARMVRIYKRYDSVDMTPEAREEFERAVLKFKGRQSSDNFAFLSIDINRVEAKVDKVLKILDDRLPPKP